MLIDNTGIDIFRYRTISPIDQNCPRVVYYSTLLSLTSSIAISRLSIDLSSKTLISGVKISGFLPSQSIFVANHHIFPSSLGNTYVLTDLNLKLGLPYHVTQH